MRILLLSKKENPFCSYAEAALKSYFNKDEYISVRGGRGEPLEPSLSNIHPEYIISFVSPWIIPTQLLDTAQRAAINFHPGSPDYPGTGCYNFALYEGAKQYGVTVHHMAEKVDTGSIIMTSYFDVAPFETVESLKLKSMTRLLLCFEKILNIIANNEELPAANNEKWRRKPFTRKQMLELFKIDPFLHDEAETRRRIRAASYPSASGGYISIHGYDFYLPKEERKPLV